MAQLLVLAALFCSWTTFFQGQVCILVPTHGRHVQVLDSSLAHLNSHQADGIQIFYVKYKSLYVGFSEIT